MEIVSIFKTIILKSFIIAAIIASAYVTKKIVNFVIQKICSATNINHIICMVLETINLIIIAIIAFVLILMSLGFNLPSLYALEHKIAALGFSGVLLTFGLKDIIENIFAGMMIMKDRKFHVGDYISTKEWHGKVIEVDVRHTILKTDNETIVIPNSVIYSSTITIVHNPSKHDSNKKNNNV